MPVATIFCGMMTVMVSRFSPLVLAFKAGYSVHADDLPMPCIIAT